MAGFDHAPPPFFKRGPAPLALLTFYILLSLAIFVVDLRFRSLDLLRQSIALVVDPVQRIAQTPGSLVDYARNYLEGMQSLQRENDELRHAKLNNAPDLLRLGQLEAENERLRRLLVDLGRGIVGKRSEKGRPSVVISRRTGKGGSWRRPFPLSRSFKIPLQVLKMSSSL